MRTLIRFLFRWEQRLTWLVQRLPSIFAPWLLLIPWGFMLIFQLPFCSAWYLPFQLVGLQVLLAVLCCSFPLLVAYLAFQMTLPWKLSALALSSVWYKILAKQL